MRVMSGSRGPLYSGNGVSFATLQPFPKHSTGSGRTFEKNARLTRIKRSSRLIVDSTAVDSGGQGRLHNSVKCSLTTSPRHCQRIFGQAVQHG